VPPVKVSAVVDRPAAEVFAYVTDPGRFHEWQQGVIDGRLEASGDAADGSVPRVGAKCLTTRRIGGADRTVTSVLTQVDPPRSWGVRGIDGPVRELAEDPDDHQQRGDDEVPEQHVEQQLLVCPSVTVRRPAQVRDGCVVQQAV